MVIKTVTAVKMLLYAVAGKAGTVAGETWVIFAVSRLISTAFDIEFYFALHLSYFGGKRFGYLLTVGHIRQYHKMVVGIS